MKRIRMKTLFYIIGGLVCVGLIIGAMYVALTLGLSVYIAHENNVRGQEYAAQQRAGETQQMQNSIASLGNNMTPGVMADQRDKDELAGKLPSLFADPEGYGTEDNWLASTIIREIAGMAFYAAQPGTPLPDLKVKAMVDPTVPSVQVAIDGWGASTTTSDLTPAFAWDPSGYAPLARQLIGTTAAAPEPELADNDVLANLLELTGPKLAAEDMQLSANLQSHPSSWQDHEAAALLLTALALRNEGSTYADNRALLCKATAHLALAQAWRGDAHPTWPGLIAGAAIRTLAGREVDALQHLDNLSAQPDLPGSAKPWIAALQMRAKQDWRVTEVTEKSPLLLKLEWVRILQDDLDDDEAKDRLQKVVVQPPYDPNAEVDKQETNPDTLLVDWSRIFGASPYYEDSDDSVKNAEYRLDLEFHEMAEILKIEKADAFDMEHLATIYGEPATDTVAPDASGKTTLRVIGAGGFKAISLGHVFDGLIAKDIAGDTNQDAAQAQNMFAKMETLFKDVPGYEFARLNQGFLEGDELKKVYADRVAAKKTWRIWEVPYELTMAMPGAGRVKAFYRTAVPFGTVYEPGLGQRYTFINAVNPQTYPSYETPELDRIKKLPVNDAIKAINDYNHKYNEQIRVTGPQGPQPLEQELLKLDPDEYVLAQDHVPDDKLLAATGRFLDDNINPLERIANLDAAHLGDADRIMVLRKEVALEPVFGFRAAIVLRGQGLVDEAAEMDRKAFNSGYNAIGISNSVLPLVDYDLAHGLKDEALKVAKFAGDVNSEMGLSTYCFALEKLGRLDEAEAVAKLDAQTYNDDSWVLNFELRHPDRYPQVYADTMKQAFPHGLVHATLADFTGSPVGGDQIKSDSDQLRAAGLQPDDVIVGLDGYRVDSDAQYMIVRALSLDSKMDFIIWRSGKYLEMHAAVPGRRMMVNIGDYKAKP